MATTAQADPSLVLSTRGIRVVLCDPDYHVRADLKRIIAPDPLLIVVGEAGDWPACEHQVENLVPELLIARAELIPKEWVARSAQDTFAPVVLPVKGLDDVIEKYSDAGISLEPNAVRSSLDRALAEIYDRKAKQLLYLVGQYVAGSEVSNRYESVLKAESEGQVSDVPTDAVIAVVAARKHVVLQTSSGEKLLREPIHRVVESLDPSAFIRIHRSVIINFNHLDLRVSSAKSAQVVMKDGTRYPVGRNYREALAAQLQRFARVA